MIHLMNKAYPVLSDLTVGKNRSLFPHHIKIILEIMIKVVNFHYVKACFAQHLDRQLLAPHSAQTGAVLSQRNRHAVHGGYRIEQRRNRVIQVIFELRGRAYILHQESAAGLKCFIDAIQHILRRCLVVDGVESGDPVEQILFGF